jgi:hypothetical protein
MDPSVSSGNDALAGAAGLSECTFIDHGVSFDLDQPVPINQTCDLRDGTCRSNVVEVLAVDTSHHRPILDTGEENPGSHDIAQVRAGLFEGGSNDLEAATGLRGGIAPADSLAIRSDRRGTGDRDDRAHAHCA